MKNTYSITEAQRDLPRMVRQLRSPAALTRHDEAVAYVVPREQWEMLLETMELLADKNFTRHLARIEAGKVRYVDASELSE